MAVVKQNKALSRAISAINNGEIIICPTDTVYGFLADASNKKAIDRIYKIKKRAKSKPLPFFISNIKKAKELTEINEKQEKILKKYWPGKYTFILKKKKGIKFYGVAKDTIALRIPRHKFLNTLLKKINKPLAQTSVNISGQPSLTKIRDVLEIFGGKDAQIFIIGGGDLKRSKPSVIIDLTADKAKILRK